MDVDVGILYFLSGGFAVIARVVFLHRSGFFSGFWRFRSGIPERVHLCLRDNRPHPDPLPEGEGD